MELWALRELSRKHKDFMVDQGLYRPFDGFNSDFIGFCKFFLLRFLLQKRRLQNFNNNNTANRRR